MNQYAVQLNNCTSYEEIKSSFSGSVSIISDRRVERESVFCPKPRRFPLANSAVNDPIRPLKWYQSSNQVEPCESRVGIDLLDIILPNSSKAGVGVGDQLYSQLGSSPPFFCGSPPSRVSNPLIQDVRFRDEMFTPISPPIQVPGGSSSPRKGGCMMITNFGNNPTVRVEGFDCLDRDRQRNCSIPTLA